MKFAAIIAAVLTTAKAVKENMTQIGAGDQTESEGYMQETKTDVTYAAVDLDQIQKDIEAWFGNTASPFIGEHRDLVYKAALAEMERDNGALLETCDEGTACRTKYIGELKIKIIEIWKRTLTSFKETIATAVLETREEVDRRWTSLVQCQIDKPCCSVSEIFWINNVTKIQSVRAVYSSFVEKWFEFDLRRIEIEAICPISINYACEAMGPCWDGTPRDSAAECQCPGHYPAKCPATECRNGMETRELNTCKCINAIPSNAFDVFTEYDATTESVIITFNDLNGQQDMEGYYVYLNEHWVHCNEDQELINKNMKCTVPLGTVMGTPFDFTYGDLVQAQIADVHDGKVESELSELGGTAVLPEMEVIIEKASHWEGSFDQITIPSLYFDVPVHEEHSMSFQKMYIGESVVGGEGDDDIGHFKLKGNRNDQNVAFFKQYYGVSTQPMGTGNWYQGDLSEDGQNLTGVYQTMKDYVKMVNIHDGVAYDKDGADFYKDVFTLTKVLDDVL